MNLLQGLLEQISGSKHTLSVLPPSVSQQPDAQSALSEQSAAHVEPSALFVQRWSAQQGLFSHDSPCVAHAGPQSEVPRSAQIRLRPNSMQQPPPQSELVVHTVAQKPRDGSSTSRAQTAPGQHEVGSSKQFVPTSRQLDVSARVGPPSGNGLLVAVASGCPGASMPDTAASAFDGPRSESPSLEPQALEASSAEATRSSGDFIRAQRRIVSVSQP